MKKLFIPILILFISATAFAGFVQQKKRIIMSQSVAAPTSECSGCLYQERSEGGATDVCTSTIDDNENTYAACNDFNFDTSSTLNGVTLEGSYAILKTGNNDHAFGIDPAGTTANVQWFGLMVTVQTDNTSSDVPLVRIRDATDDMLFHAGIAADGTFYVQAEGGTQQKTVATYSVNTKYYIKCSWTADASDATISVKTDPDAAWPTTGDWYDTSTDGTDTSVADEWYQYISNNEIVLIIDDLRWSDTESDIDYSYQ